MRPSTPEIASSLRSATARRLVTLAVLVLLAFTATGCAGTVRALGRGTGRGIARGTVEELDALGVGARLQRSMEDPQVRNAIRELARAASTGAALGFTEQLRREELRGLAADVADTFTSHVVQGLGGLDLGKQIRPLMQQTVDGMLDAALAGERQEQIEAAVTRQLEAGVHALAGGLREDLGPAMTSVFDDALQRATRELAVSLRHDLGPALSEALAGAMESGLAGLPGSFQSLFSPELAANFGKMFDAEMKPRILDLMADPQFQQGMEDMSRSISRGIIFGSNDALGTLDNLAAARGKKSILDQVTDFEATDIGIGLFLAVAQTFLLFGLAAALQRGGRRVDALTHRLAVYEDELLELLRARAARERAYAAREGARFHEGDEPPTIAPPDEHPEDEPRP
jgi:hypothetical protein